MPTNCETRVHQLLNKPLSQHAWNSDKSKLAVCPNSDEVFVFRKDRSNKWVVEDILREHDQLVTGLDWCPVTNKIITCSMDRNAYVWVTNEIGKWKPSLAALRISKGATCVSWNFDGTKFAAGSSNGSVVVGHFEKENDWWLCKHLKVNIENTITTLSWHPNGVDLVIGSIDGILLIASGYIKSIDKSASPEPICNYSEKVSTPILDVTFSPSGDNISYITHDAHLNVVHVKDGSKETFSLGELAMLQVKFVTESLLITTGHNYSPTIFGLEKSSGKWTKIDDLKATDGKKQNSSSSSAFGSAFAKFKSMDDCGVKDSKTSDSQTAGHKNTITKLSLIKSENGKISEISTSSLDGNLIIWDLESVLTTQKFSNLSI